MESRTYTIQVKLDALTEKWWLYLFLLLLFFIPSYASKGFDPRDSVDLIGQVLSDPLIYAFPVLMPIAKAIPAALIGGVMVLGNRMRRALSLYVALLYLALAFFQTAAVTAEHGLVVITGNLALVFVVALAWVWEVFAGRNDFTPFRRPMWKWWVAPVAAVAFLAPVDASTMTADLDLVRMLTNEAGMTTCMMTPVVVGLLTLYHPRVNLSVLRVTSFAGVLLGAVNMIVWFGIQRWGWWMGVMHVPLLVISAYGLALGISAGRQAQEVD